MTTQEKIAVMQAEIEGKGIEWLGNRDNNWQTTIRPVWNWQDGNYRVKPAPVRVPLTADDIPPVCWVKADHVVAGAALLVHTVYRNGVSTYTTGTLLFNEMFRDNWQYSTDRKTWLPCSKEATL